VILYLFDIDGTLLHAHGSGSGAFDEVFAAHHGLAAACAGIRFGGKTDPALVDEIFATKLGRAPSEAERAAFLDAYLPRLRARLDTAGVVVIDGAIAALEFLAARPGVRLAIATGNVRAGAEAKLAAAGLARWFEPAASGFGSDAALRAELVATAIRRNRARGPVDEVIVVGDTVHDIAAARACGATACAVATGGDRAELLGHADVVWASLAELPAWHAARFG